MVGVVPSGWLAQAAGGAVGVAAPGLRAALIEQSSPAMTRAARGNAHVRHRSSDRGPRGHRRQGRTSAVTSTGPTGWRCARRRRPGPAQRRGRPRQPCRPARWGAGSARSPVTRTGDQRLGHQRRHQCAGGMEPGATGSRRDDLDDLELERMLVEQMDGADVVASEPISLQRVGGLYSADTTQESSIGFAPHRADQLQPGVTSVRNRARRQRGRRSCRHRRSGRHRHLTDGRHLRGAEVIPSQSHGPPPLLWARGPRRRC